MHSQWNVKSKYYFFKIIVILHFNSDVIFVSRRIVWNDERAVRKTGRTKDYKGTIALVHSSYSKIPQSFTVAPSNFIPGNTQRQRRLEYVTFPSNCVSIQIGYRTKLLSGKSWDYALPNAKPKESNAYSIYFLNKCIHNIKSCRSATVFCFQFN